MAGTVDMSAVESVCSAASMIATSFINPTLEDKKTPNNCIVVVQTKDGRYADLVSKYRPPFPVCVACPDDQVLRIARAKFGQIPIKIPINEGPSAIVSKCVKLLSRQVRRPSTRRGPVGVAVLELPPTLLFQGYDLKKGVRAVFVGIDPDSMMPFVRVIKGSVNSISQRPSSMMHPYGRRLARSWRGLRAWRDGSVNRDGAAQGPRSSARGSSPASARQTPALASSPRPSMCRDAQTSSAPWAPSAGTRKPWAS